MGTVPQRSPSVPSPNSSPASTPSRHPDTTPSRHPTVTPSRHPAAAPSRQTTTPARQPATPPPVAKETLATKQTVDGKWWEIALNWQCVALQLVHNWLSNEYLQIKSTCKMATVEKADGLCNNMDMAHQMLVTAKSVWRRDWYVIWDWYVNCHFSFAVQCLLNMLAL